QHLCCYRGDIVAGHPADTFVAHGPTQRTTHGTHDRQQVFHEDMRMEVTPSHAASLDVAFDELVPGEMRIGGATVSEDAKVHNEADASVHGRIRDRLHLMDHVDSVARHQE